MALDRERMVCRHGGFIPLEDDVAIACGINAVRRLSFSCGFNQRIAFNGNVADFRNQSIGTAGTTIGSDG